MILLLGGMFSAMAVGYATTGAALYENNYLFIYLFCRKPTANNK